MNHSKYEIIEVTMNGLIFTINKDDWKKHTPYSVDWHND